MDNINFQFEGMDTLIKSLTEVQEEFGRQKTAKMWNKIMLAAIEPTYKIAKSLVPIESGQLKDHLYMTAHRPTSRDKTSSGFKGETFLARVSVSAKRAESVEHTSFSKKGKEITKYSNRPVALAIEFGTASKPNGKPFLRPALSRSATDVIDKLGDEIKYALYKIAAEKERASRVISKPFVNRT